MLIRFCGTIIRSYIYESQDGQQTADSAIDEVYLDHNCSLCFVFPKCIQRVRLSPSLFVEDKYFFLQQLLKEMLPNTILLNFKQLLTNGQSILD